MNVPSFKSLHYAGPGNGPALIVLGAVHGNEVCGTRAIESIAADFNSGALRLERGRVTLVPVANPLAYAGQRRAGDRNLNRRLMPTSAPADFEDHVANWLCPLLAQHDVLLDLHSFHSGDQPFVMVGPENNQGSLEPFAKAAQEVAWAKRLGVGRAVDGWLSTYAEGVSGRLANEGAGHPGLDLDPRYGVGTTEYMRLVGGQALTLECGQHADPNAVHVAHRAVMNTLAHWGLIESPSPPPAMSMEGLRLCRVVDRLNKADEFSRDWKSFDKVCAGDVLAIRHNSEIVTAPFDGWIVFPSANSNAGQEWFYLAKKNERFR